MSAAGTGRTVRGCANREWYGVIIPCTLDPVTARLCGRSEGEESLEEIRLPFKEDCWVLGIRGWEAAGSRAAAAATHIDERGKAGFQPDGV